MSTVEVSVAPRSLRDQPGKVRPGLCSLPAAPACPRLVAMPLRSLPGHLPVALRMSHLCACLALHPDVPFRQEYSHIRLGSTLMASLELDHLCKDPAAT